MKYEGGCHCKAVRYEVEVDLSTVISCNCSLCSKRGHLLAFTSPENFKLLSGEEKLKDYLFNKHVIHHLFCSNCGIESFAQGAKPDGGKMVAINARCLDGVDIATLNIKHYDGKSH
jgi:hypothetical protein